MCRKDKAHIWFIIVGIVCVATLIGILRYGRWLSAFKYLLSYQSCNNITVFNLSTFDIIFLAPIVLVIGFAYTIKLMVDVVINFYV